MSSFKHSVTSVAFITVVCYGTQKWWTTKKNCLISFMVNSFSPETIKRWWECDRYFSEVFKNTNKLAEHFDVHSIAFYTLLYYSANAKMENSIMIWCQYCLQNCSFTNKPLKKQHRCQLYRAVFLAGFPVKTCLFIQYVAIFNRLIIGVLMWVEINPSASPCGVSQQIYSTTYMYFLVKMAFKSFGSVAV